jgi:hypothetical protein
LAQAEADKEVGRIHGVQAAAEAEQEAQGISLMCILHLQEATLVITADLETLQKDHQVEAQVGLTLMIQEEDLKVLRVAQDFTV